MGSRRWLLVAGLLLSAGPARAEWASIVFDAESGTIMQASHDRAPRYPASLTKIMTAYLVLEAIRAKRLAFGQALLISAAAAAQPAVKLSLIKGRTITLEEALNATILRSANDAAVVLAEAVAGDERAFARAMTEKARALGMRATRFTNATGLPDRRQVTTAHDIALLARALMRDFPRHFPLFSRTSATYGKQRFGTVNGWLTSYRGADGIKTGFTCAAGFNLVASARKGRRRVVAVIMGGPSRQARAGKARELVDAAFARAGKASRPLGVLGQRGGQVVTTPPPHVLPGAQCAPSKQRPRESVLEAGPFPGWGLVIGSYSSRAKALGEIEKRRVALGRMAAKSQPAVVASARGGVTRYRALLVALGKDESLTSCRRLRDAGAYCVRLNPTWLNNARAKWR